MPKNSLKNLEDKIDPIDEKNPKSYFFLLSKSTFNSIEKMKKSKFLYSWNRTVCNTFASLYRFHIIKKTGG